MSPLPPGQAQPTDDNEAAAPAATLSTNAANALVHLYRAEVGRLVAYRTRMDTTTNWAITTSALLITFAFNNIDISHIVLLFLMLLNYFFLWLEARRFRSYEASRYRAQILEEFFYPALLGEQVDPQWPRRLLASLHAPGQPMRMLGGLGWRLRRIYLAIHMAVVGAWLIKLFVAAGTFDLARLVARASIGPAPGWVVVGAVTVYTCWLVALAGGARRLYPAGDDETHEATDAAPA